MRHYRLCVHTTLGKSISCKGRKADRYLEEDLQVCVGWVDAEAIPACLMALFLPLCLPRAHSMLPSSRSSSDVTLPPEASFVNSFSTSSSWYQREGPAWTLTAANGRFSEQHLQGCPEAWG